MANEILKDEIMSDEQLDKVAGGNRYQCMGDIHFLNEVGGLNLNDWQNQMGDYMERQVRDGWAQFGIECDPDSTCNTNSFYDNDYYLNGKQISRQEAFAHVAKLKGLDFHNMPINL